MLGYGKKQVLGIHRDIYWGNHILGNCIVYGCICLFIRCASILRGLLFSKRAICSNSKNDKTDTTKLDFSNSDTIFNVLPKNNKPKINRKGRRGILRGNRFSKPRKLNKDRKLNNMYFTVIKPKSTWDIPFSIYGNYLNIYYELNASMPVVVYLIDEVGFNNVVNKKSTMPFYESNLKKDHSGKVKIGHEGRWHLLIYNPSDEQVMFTNKIVYDP